MRFGLKPEVIENINGVFKKYPQLDTVILYGSRARGNYRKGSDIDLTLTGQHLDFHILNKISDDLDDLLTPYKFDISLFNDIDNQDLLNHIEHVGIEFYNKKNPPQ